MRRSLHLTTLGLTLLLSAAAARGGEPTARELLDQVRDLNHTTRHWKDRTQKLTLTIVDRRGGERVRDLEIFTKRYEQDADRTLLFFLGPAEVRGIGLLQWTQPSAADQQWLYLPELKRVRQITGSSKRDSFAGTDFSFQDLAIISEITDWTDAKAKATRLREETLDGHQCAVIEFEPTDPDITYGKIRMWLGLDDLIAHQYEFDDRQGELAKRLLVSDIRPIEGIPTAYRLEMRNERTGSRSVAAFGEVQYNTNLADDLFSERRLERGV